MVDYVALQQIPEERMIAGSAQFAEFSSAEELQEAWGHVTPKAASFLKYRILAVNDAEARHLMGHARDDGSTRTCGCGRHIPGWIDMRDTTLADWKHSPYFMRLYEAILHQPVMAAAVRLQALAPAAVLNLERVLDLTNTDIKDTTRMNAAKLVLEATGLKATEGVNRPHSGVIAAQAQESFQLRLAKEQYRRGVEISGPQRQLLLEAGVVMEEPAGTVTIISPDRTERTLDGEDVPAVWTDAGPSNEAYLPD